MDETDTIEVIVLERRHPPTGRQALPTAEELAERVKRISAIKFRESLERSIAQAAELVRDLPTTEGSMQLEEVSIGLGVTASGEVRLVAGIGVEVGSTITLTFKVGDSSDGVTSRQ